MSRLFVSNFGFEIELGGGSVPASVIRSTSGLADCWVPIAEECDRVLCGQERVRLAADSRDMPKSGTAGISNGEIAHVIPWGWTRSAAELARSCGCDADIPGLDTVEDLNRRRWAWRQESSRSLAPEGADVIGRLDELHEKLVRASSFGCGWVLKADLAMAGRQQRRGREAVVSDSLAGWVTGLLRRDGLVFAEPWLDAISEFGLQYEIGRRGEIQLRGITELLCTEAGGYRGTRIQPRNAASGREGFDELLAMLEPVLTRICETGYFGPLGIDAMSYRDCRGKKTWRPLQDLNARYTMGRLALGWSDRVPVGGAATVLQVRWSDPPSVDQRLRRLASENTVISQLDRYSPRGSPATSPSGLVLLIVETASELVTAEAMVLAALENRVG